MERDTYIKRVQVYGRTDCCPEQTNNYDVRIGDNTDPFMNSDCPGVFSGSQTIECDLSGRYLFIVKRDAGHLSLCEVEAYSW
mmetsp:Transcript_11771/g.11701  ORF Transcript_11771/g.11701 Transcript_11771/m.11701 type:complete len:82 (-) Transcript_11771:71-316(-)